MPRRADVIVDQAITAQWDGGGTNYLIETPTGVLYLVYCDDGSDVLFSKSTDGGLTWSNPTVVFAGTVTNLSCWYDKWSGLAGGLIHCAYTESGGSDTLYRTIDTASSDGLSTQTTIFNGTSRASGGNLSIARARGGNVYCKTMIDAGAEGGFFRLPNANVPNGAWDAARTVDEALATTDQNIVLPGFAADNQDMLMIFWDASANEVSRKIYDDSANSWAETSIATSMTDSVATTAFPHFAAAVDLANSRVIVVAWSAIDTANADLRCWFVTESAITETSANVVLNSADDQGLCGIGIDTNTGYLYVFYAGKSDGSETFATTLNIYYKGSADGGATWGPETLLTTSAKNINWLAVAPRFAYPPAVAFYDNTTKDVIRVNAPIMVPKADLSLGV